MPYPFPELAKLLKFRCEPAVYLDLVKTLTVSWPVRFSNASQPYWASLPEYTYARCPLCGVTLRGGIDTYSLAGWEADRYLLQEFFHSDYPAIAAGEASGWQWAMPRFAHCPHFFGIHRFINLHEQPPFYPNYWSNRNGELPYLTPWFFHADFQTYAVLHALPVCRIEQNEFVPTYTVFGLAYFSEDRREIFKRWHKVEETKSAHDREYFPGLLHLPVITHNENYNKSLYDLAAWAKQGKLGWLDIAEPELPLVIGPGQALAPVYQNLPGSVMTYVWRRGKRHDF